MAKKNHAKKALISSLLALFICFTMLIGTTFAWFTDSAVSANNVIKSGNLDVDLVINGKSVDEGEAEAAFGEDILWEPGVVETALVKIVNKGNLALKYKLDVIMDGADKKLAEVIDVYYGAGATAVPADRTAFEDGIDSTYVLVGTLADMSAEEDGAAHGALLPADSNADPVAADLEQKGSASGAIILKMRETADNAYQGLSLGNVYFNLVATQYTEEVDSFDDQYDKDAEYPEVVLPDHFVYNLDDLKAALAKGGYIKLKNDITLDNMFKLENGVEVTLDMNGKTMYFEPNAEFKPGNPMLYPLTGTKLTITGNGTFDLGDSFDAALVYPAGEVVIENGNFIRDRVPDGKDPDEVQTLFMGVKSVGASVVIKDGYFDGGYYDANAADIEALIAGPNTLIETDADEANRGKAADKNSVRTAIKNNTSLLINLSWSSAAGTQDFRIYGGTFVGANPAWGDEGCAMPITPNYLRPWSYYQGLFLEGQQMHDGEIKLPAGYSITEGITADGRPTYTVNYNK